MCVYVRHGMLSYTGSGFIQGMHVSSLCTAVAGVVPLVPSICLLTQGDLTDPLYFDFISFCQSATLQQEMPRGKQTFQVWLSGCITSCC